MHCYDVDKAMYMRPYNEFVNGYGVYETLYLNQEVYDPFFRAFGYGDMATQKIYIRIYKIVFCTLTVAGDKLIVLFSCPQCTNFKL